MFLACSVQEDVAMDFVERRNPAHEGIVWHIYVPLKSGTASVNHIARTNCEGEDEFLFAPYSVFTVRHVEWKSQPTVNAYAVQPHIIEVDVASDNLRHPPDLPLAPWC